MMKKDNRNITKLGSSKINYNFQFWRDIGRLLVKQDMLLRYS
jgi:hypothetical protein